MTTQKSNWWWWVKRILIAGVIIFLVVQIFKGCGKGSQAPSHTDEAKGVEMTGLWQKQEFDKLNNKIDHFGAKDSILIIQQIDNLRAEMLTAIKVGLAQKQSTILVRQYEVAKGNKDTVAQLATCDSIIPKYISMGNLLTEQQLNFNQEKSVYQQQIANRDSLQAVTLSTYNGLKRAFDTTTNAYRGLYTDYRKQVRKAKVNRTIGRITAGATVVLGGLLYFKK